MSYNAASLAEGKMCGKLAAVVAKHAQSIMITQGLPVSLCVAFELEHKALTAVAKPIAITEAPRGSQGTPA